MLTTPGAELRHRLSVLRAGLRDQGLDGALVHGVTNLYYLSGTAQQAHLWVPTDGAEVLLVRRVLARARRESALERVEPLASLRELADAIGPGRRIGMELDIMPVSLFQRYQRALPGLDAADVGPALRLQRARKSAWEVDRVRAAAAAADRTFAEVRDALREGMTELELSIVAESAERRHGFQGMLRWRATTGFECPWVHVLSGSTALEFSFADTPYGGAGVTPAAPFGASGHRIARGEPVNLDFALARDGYIHDMTRTLAVGPLPDEAMRGYEACRAVHADFVAAARPGVTGEELWARAVAVMEAAGFGDRFMGLGEQRVRFVGHGVGLELDELPVIAPRQTAAVAAGNVIALEPKVFLPDVGAVGLENTYLISGDGVERLTVSDDDIAVVDAG